MIGCLILSTRRSGSGWLSEMVSTSGQMGNCGELLHAKWLGSRLKNKSIEQLTNEIIAHSATENGRFSLNLFPRQFYKVYQALDIDLIRYLQVNHSVSLVVLRRRDRIRQAISLAKSQMTGAWSTRSKATGKARYDFDRICQCYFILERNNHFWPSYLGLHGLEHETIFYEDMMESPRACIDWIAGQLGVEPPKIPDQTEYKVQRDDVTEEWVERFRKDVATHDTLRYAEGRSEPARSPANLLRFLTKKQLKPFQI